VEGYYQNGSVWYSPVREQKLQIIDIITILAVAGYLVADLYYSKELQAYIAHMFVCPSL
jgi:hypothetical protein